MTTSSAEAESKSSPEKKQQKQQRARQTPPLGTVSIDNGWRYAAGRGVWYQNPQTGDWVQKLDWCPKVRHAVRYCTQDGQTITKRYEIWVGDQREVVSLSDLTRGAALWGRFHGAGVITGRMLSDALINIVQHQARQLPDTPGYPAFRDDRLSLPPTSYLPEGYSRGEGSSRAALQALAKEIAPHPRACLVMGLSAAAPWVSALQLQPTTVHLEGNTTCGKSTLLTAAASLWGTGYKGVVKIWSGTKISIPGHLRDLGVLPAYRDELSTAGLSGADRATLFSTIMEGAYRSARTRDDLPRPSASWASILFSTGNQACVPESHISAGHPKGIIELHGDDDHPFIPPKSRDKVQAATNAPEMAGAWVPFARRLTGKGMKNAWEKAGEDLGGAPEGGLAWHMWRCMALGVAGARALADVTGVQELADNALLEAAGIIDSAPERMIDIRADQGQRLIDAVTEFLSVRPGAFGLGDSSTIAHTDQIGFIKEIDGRELVCVYPTKHDAIAAAAGVEDVAVAHRQLRSDGRLVTSAGQGLGKRVRPPEGKKPIRVYAYNISGDDAMNGLNAMNNAGQSVHSEPGGDMNTGTGDYEQPVPRCAACGQMMTIIEAGQRFHPGCEPEEETPEAPGGAVQEELPTQEEPPAELEPEPEPFQEPEPVVEDPPPAETPGPETAPVPVRNSGQTPGRPDARTSDDRAPVEELDPAEELEAFIKSMHKHGLDQGAGEADMAAALALLTEVTGGLRWVSYAGQTGQAALSWLCARYGAMKAPTPLDDDRARALAEKERETVTRYHVHPGLGRQLAAKGTVISGYDINGQYPNAAGLVALGDGNPKWLENPQSIRGLIKKPGYVKLKRNVTAAKVPELKFIKEGGETPKAGDWLPMPVIAFLVEDLGLTVDAAEVCWWPDNGRRLRTFVERMYKGPREQLQRMEPSIARDLARSALKVMVNDMLGMFRSKKWSGESFYRPDWYDQYTSYSEMNALRLARKADRPALVKACDSLYFAAEPPCRACAEDDRDVNSRRKQEYPKGHKPDECGKPKGLVVGTPLGKVKLERVATVTQDMRDAYKAGSAKSFHDAVKRAVAEQKGAGE